MKSFKVSELMISLKDFLVVEEETSLLEVILSLGEKQKEGNFHSTVFVKNKKGEIIANLGILEIFKGIEPKYKEIAEIDLSRFGYSDDFVISVLKNYDLWAHPLENLCKKIPEIKVREIYKPLDSVEFVKKEDTLDLAVHKMVMNNLQLLLVKNEEEDLIGVLRAIDVFLLICKQAKKCNL